MLGFFGFVIIFFKAKEKKVCQESEDYSKEELDQLFALGICYFRGESVTRDLKKAFEYFKKASDHGHLFSRIALANCHINGWGTEQNTKKGRQIHENTNLESSEKLSVIMSMVQTQERV